MSVNSPDEDFKVIENKTRRQIISYLARQKTVTFTQIMNFLELDPLWQCGTINYHLKLLAASGIARKHEDGYVLTSKGRSIANMMEKMEKVDVHEKLNRDETTEGILKRLNPRSVCWLLAVGKGRKPTATILSVDKEDWNGFLGILSELGLCWSYEGINGKILNSSRNQAERLFESLPIRSDEPRVNLLFDSENWKKLLVKKKPSFQILGSSSAKLTPIIYEESATGEVVVSKDLEVLMMFSQFNEKPWSNHSQRGKALGYPDCCIEAYEKGPKNELVDRNAFPRAKFFKEIIQLGLDQKMPIEFWAIAHTPHSANCEDSLKLGRRYLDAVKSYSSTLYDHIQQELRLSYLPWSVGERFLSFKEIPQDQFPLELADEYDGIFDWAKKIVSENVKLTLGEVQRPLAYQDWEDYPARCRLVPKIRGLKWIAYSPGKGILVRDTSTNEVYICHQLRWVLPSAYDEIMSTVCRVYKCN